MKFTQKPHIPGHSPTHTRTHTRSRCKRALAHTRGLAPLRLAPCRMQKGRTRYPRRHHPWGRGAAAAGAGSASLHKLIMNKQTEIFINILHIERASERTRILHKLHIYAIPRASIHRCPCKCSHCKILEAAKQRQSMFLWSME